MEQAIANADRLLAQSEDESVAQALKATLDKWQRTAVVHAERACRRPVQLQELIARRCPSPRRRRAISNPSSSNAGSTLTVAMLVVLGSPAPVPPEPQGAAALRARVPQAAPQLPRPLVGADPPRGHADPGRLGPMIVFYVVEDWVLFSLSILLLLAIAWTLRQALPRYMHQIQIFLNIGAVREGERLNLDGLPWRVQQINVFCTLVNPVAELTQRVPSTTWSISSRGRRGRTSPGFPARKGDWVILSDQVRGKVTGISPELVQLVERGGAQLTYQTGDFLAKSPRNLATNFRIKEIMGISYKLQKDSTTRFPETLHAYIQQRAEQEGYGDQLLSLRVEFALANNSSLDLAVMADFSGELGDLYNRLRRAIQRWFVDACTEYGWEIPFPQMTLHGTVARTD